MSKLYDQLISGKINKGITHAGNFHADEVFSTALLKLINPEFEVIRTFNIPEGWDQLTYDIGMGIYDHHQIDGRIRDNGIKYAAFGLLWEQLGADFLGSEREARIYDENFVQYLDHTDNTGEFNIMSRAIGDFLPNWENGSNPETYDKYFWKAVEFAKTILSNTKSSALSRIKAYDVVQETYKKAENKKIIVLDRFCPWKNVLCETEAIFVIYPSTRGGWTAQAVTVNPTSNEMKCPFLEEWGGKPKEELSIMIPNRELFFCHKSLFLINTGTLDDAIWACNESILQNYTCK